MVRLLTTLTFFLTSIYSFSQATLFTENFEVASSWSTAGDTSPNFWITGESCAGNGTSEAGTNAMYISIGGASSGCGATGDIQYNYNNAGSGTLSAISYKKVYATCATDMQVTFDYKIDGVASEDFGELVYSTDGGTTWTPAGGHLPISSSWTTTTINLPAAVNSSNFELGFRFTYNDATINGSPLAIDNIVVTGTDTVDPTMTCPTNIQLPVTTNCEAICIDFTDRKLTLADNCTDSADIVITQNIAPSTVFSSGPGGTETLILTATDEAGNNTTCTITLDIVDADDPVITCPGDTNIYVNANCDGILGDYTGSAVVSDNCSSVADIIVSQTPAPGLVINGSIVSTTVTLTAEDEAGNTSTCSFIARTIDTIPATITCPSDTVVYANGTCSGVLGNYTGNAIVSDNCVPTGSLSVLQSPISGTTISSDQTITLTVTGAIPTADQSCSFTAVFIDTISPTIVCASPSPLYANGSCETTLIDYTGSAIVNDNCTAVPVVTQTPSPGTVLSSTSNTTVTLTVTDPSGNSSQCSFVQPVLDTISPTISCPGDQTAFADINCFSTLADYTGMAAASDNCSSSLTITQAAIPGTNITDTTVVTLTVSDDSGNNATCSFNVNLIDNTAPTITCPNNLTVGTNSGCDYVLSDFTGSATGADNCTAAIDISYTQTPSAGTMLNVGTHTITIQGSDLSGNTGSCTFEITVEDQTVPTISCPSNQNIYANTSCEGDLIDYTGLATVSDNCSSLANLTLSQSPAPSTTISSTTLITLTVTDENNNDATCVFNAILVDTISPAVTCPGDQTVNINSSCQYTIPDLSGNVTGTDNCSALMDMTVGQTPNVGSTGSGITPVIITLTDQAGNTSTCTTNLLPNDIDPPTINCPVPPHIVLTGTCDFSVPFYGSSATVLDNCSNYSIDQTPSVGSIINPGSHDITLTVTDAGGNTDQCMFTISVEEFTPPTITCPSNISTCDPVVTYSSPSYSDNCLVSMSQTDASGLTTGMSFPVGVTTQEYTAIDSTGNTAVCSFTIEILDYPSPAVIAEDTIRLCGETSTIVSADANPTGTGLWTVLSGQGDFNNQFANTTGINNLPNDTTILQWEVSSLSCGSSADTIVIISTPEDLASSTQDTITVCTDSITILQANQPLYGTGHWSTNENAIIADSSSANTTASLPNSGWFEFVWTITNEGCPTTRDTVRVYTSQKPIIFTPDTSLCIEDNVLFVEATPPGDEETVEWNPFGAGTMVDDYTSSSTNMYGFTHGTNTVVYTTFTPYCPPKSDTFVVSVSLCDGFNPVIPTLITPNFDGKNDLFTIDFLSQVYPNCEVTIFNRWGSIVFESIGYDKAWDGTYNNEPLPMGTYFYRIQLNDSKNTIYQGDISIIH